MRFTKFVLVNQERYDLSTYTTFQENSQQNWLRNERNSILAQFGALLTKTWVRSIFFKKMGFLNFHILKLPKNTKIKKK